MKASIITRHAVPNYGSVLQSYASQKTFEQLGYDAEIIDYVRYDERGKDSIMTNCNIGRQGLTNKIKRTMYYCLQYYNSLWMLKAFDGFQKQYLRLSNRRYGSVEELAKHLPKADVYVTGSDQVWGKIATDEYDGAYFLQFAPKDKYQIAFSASFGKTELDPKLLAELDGLLANYSALLVREASAVELIAQHTGKTAKHILDPTLLLDRQDWEQLCEPTGLEGKDYIFVYQLHHNKDMERYITQLQIKTGLPVYRVHPSLFYMLKPGRFIHLPTPGQFLSYIKHAKYMVTDSFHGTVFASIFNTQFADILPETTGTRIVSLLELLGLKHRILSDLKDFSWMEKKIDFERVNSILAAQKQQTLEALVESLPPQTNTVAQMNLHLQCTGCGACAQLCPTGAIRLAADEEGFLMPKIDESRCNHCGLCSSRCPQLNPIPSHSVQPAGYAAQIRDSRPLKDSASGGVFYQAAKHILLEGGVVYGVAMGENLRVEHTRVSRMEDLPKLQGSKYVQSHILDSYQQVKADLKQGYSVLFSGTPCQVAGLYAFLGQDYDKLYTMDLICHGVPSQKLLRKAIDFEQKQRKSPMVSYEFRNKDKRGWDCDFKKTFADGSVSYGSGKLDAYYRAFLEGETYRECCYQCQYATQNRVGDITIGDFWGIEQELPQFPADQGASCVLVNSPKGEQLFAALSTRMKTVPVDCERIARHNHNLVAPTTRKALRNMAYMNISQRTFDQMDVYRCHRFSLKSYLSYKLPKSTKKKLKKILKG